jgi:hypothetical protein
MSGDGTDDVKIPAAFVSKAAGVQIMALKKSDHGNTPPQLYGTLSGLVWEDDVASVSGTPT